MAQAWHKPGWHDSRTLAPFTPHKEALYHSERHLPKILLPWKVWGSLLHSTTIWTQTPCHTWVGHWFIWNYFISNRTLGRGQWLVARWRRNSQEQQWGGNRVGCWHGGWGEEKQKLLIVYPWLQSFFMWLVDFPLSSYAWEYMKEAGKAKGRSIVITGIFFDHCTIFKCIGVTMTWKFPSLSP